MGYGLIDQVVRWGRSGRSEPWIEDSFLAGLSTEAQRRIERHASLMNATRRRGDDAAARHQVVGPDTPVALVLSATVAVFQTRQDGGRVLVGLAGPGDLVSPDAVLVDASPPICFVPSPFARVITIPRQKFREVLARDEEIYEAFMMALAQQVRRLTLPRVHAGRKVEQRVWAFLVDAGRRYGRSASGGSTYLELGLTRADLASAVGASVNAVEAALGTLRKMGKIDRSYGSIGLCELPTDEELDRSFGRWETGE